MTQLLILCSALVIAFMHVRRGWLVGLLCAVPLLAGMLLLRVGLWAQLQQLPAGDYRAQLATQNSVTAQLMLLAASAAVWLLRWLLRSRR